MAPHRCPACGRFLQRRLVEALEQDAQACPGCEATLTGENVVPPTPPRTREGVGGTSVRPPDLPAAQVRDDGMDVLAGWDVGADDATIARWHEDHRPFPTDTVLVGAGALAGAVIGAGLASSARVRGGLAGAATGFVATAVARRIWRLHD